MDRDTTTSGLSADKLAQLWDLGSQVDQDGTENNQEQSKAELLRDRLAQKFPLDQIIAQILPKTLVQVCDEIQPFAGNSYGILINDPGTDISILKRIKDNTKNQAQHTDGPVAYDVSTAVYYAAIASALVYHGKRITSFSYDHLLGKYVALLKHPWLTSDFRRLFQEAERICREESDKGTPDAP
jgi:hypothetical protein